MSIELAQAINSSVYNRPRFRTFSDNQLTFESFIENPSGVFYDIHTETMFTITTPDQGIDMSDNYGKTWRRIFTKDSVSDTYARNFYRHRLGYGFVWSYGANFCRITPGFTQAEHFGDMYHPLNSSLSVDEDNTSGVIMYGEYGGAGGIDGKRIWRSENYGATWTAIHEDLEIQHWHSVQRDPYTDNWWACAGDTNAQTRIKQSTDAGLTWTTKASGLQCYRTCGLGFTEAFILWAEDYPSALSGQVSVWKILRTDIDGDWNVKKTLVGKIEGPAYGIVKTREGKFLIWSPAENREYSAMYLTDGIDIVEIFRTNRYPGTETLSSGVAFATRVDRENRTILNLRECGLMPGQYNAAIVRIPTGVIGDKLPMPRRPYATAWYTAANISGTGTDIVSSDAILIPIASLGTFVSARIEIKFTEIRTGGTGSCEAWSLHSQAKEAATEGGTGGNIISSRLPASATAINRTINYEIPVVQGRFGSDESLDIKIKAKGSAADTAYLVSDIMARLIITPI